MAATRVLSLGLLIALACTAAASAPPTYGHDDTVATTPYAVALAADFVAFGDATSGKITVQYTCTAVTDRAVTVGCTRSSGGVSHTDYAASPAATISGTSSLPGPASGVRVCAFLVGVSVPPACATPTKLPT